MLRLSEKFLTKNASDSGSLENPFKRSVREGEEGLMLAVLDDAIESFQRYAFAEDKKGQTLFQEAEEWIFEKDSDWFFSFENICDTLGLDTGYIREGLQRWTEETRRKPSLESKKHPLTAGKKKKKAGSIHARPGFRALA